MNLSKRSPYLAAAVCSLILGCREDTSIARPTPSLERMLEQPRWDAFESRPDSPEPAWLLPPHGAVPYAIGGAPSSADSWASSTPVAADAEARRQGARLYSTYCAPCHGIDGAGQTKVTRLMSHPPAPLFGGPPLPEAEHFRIISEGTKWMPSLEAQMTRRERWWVVAHVKTLERSRPIRSRSGDQESSVDDDHGGRR